MVESSTIISEPKHSTTKANQRLSMSMFIGSQLLSVRSGHRLRT
jgi:hypothetical protein